MSVFTTLFTRKPNARPAAPGPTPPPRPPFAVRSFGMSDRGRVRPSNEDRFAVVELTRTLYVRQSNLPAAAPRDSCRRGHFFVVADGMGGHRAGEVASSLSVQTIEGFLLNTLQRFSDLQVSDEPHAFKDLQAALRQADARLFAATARHPEWQGMGTTLTLAFTVNWTLFIAHAGDSRGYLLSRDELHQLTQDHTVTAELVRQGMLTPAGQALHPYRHVVTNYLGGNEPGVHVELHRFELHPGDVLLLCSDGLSDMVADDQLAAILREEPEPQRACERLIAAANAHGGKDNITAVVARFEAAESATAG